MPATEKGLRYPNASAFPNVPQDFQNLASDVDAKLSGDVVVVPPTPGGWQQYRNANGGALQFLQAYRLGTLIVVSGVLSNNVAYSSLATGVATVPTGYRPFHDAMGLGITPGMTVQVSVQTNGLVNITPSGTVAANSYHGITVIYNTGNL